MPAIHIYMGAPCRLDKALEHFLPDMGLRGRRRLIENGAVLVMGRARAAGYVVRAGAELSISTPEASPQDTLADAVPHLAEQAPLPAHGQKPAPARPYENSTPDSAPHAAPAAPSGSADAASTAVPLLCADDAPRFLEQQGGYCFFYKPAGLHSVSLRGGSGLSLESLLPRLLHGVTLEEAPADPFLTAPSPQATGAAPPAHRTASHTDTRIDEGTLPHAACPAASAPVPLPVLVQRLDQATSGILAAALRPAIAAEWRDAETRGLCCKRYLALLCGQLPEPRLATAALDTHQRRRTRVLPRADAPLRHTAFTPLAQFSGGTAARLQAALAPENAAVPVLTLAGCTIRKGARHQIRVHAAALGLPLWGDALYGSGEGRFFLHHGGLTFLDKGLTLPPCWLDCLPADLRPRVLRWLRHG